MGDKIKNRKISLFLVPIFCILFCLLFNLDPKNPKLTYTAAISLLVAIWWTTEPIPLAVTALLPTVLLPLFGVIKGKDVATYYFNSIILLFIGGFIIALAMENWNLHKRIALKIILKIGTNPKKIILGFMASTAFLSMWISNTATTMVMTPIGMALIMKMEESFNEDLSRAFSKTLLLGIAYAASIGGISTLIGTPPNLVFAKMFPIYFPKSCEISFTTWFAFAFPFSLTLLLFLYLLLNLFLGDMKETSIDSSVFHREYAKLGSMKFEEWIVLIDFLLFATLLFTRKGITIGATKIPGWSNMLPKPTFIDDGTVAMMVALPLFFIPSRDGKRVMSWDVASKLPWDIVILFGGGFALAAGIKDSGLSFWLCQKLTSFSHLSHIFVIFSVSAMTMILSQFASNTASTQMVLPILASMSIAIHINPLLLMVPATVSASCAFMLPVSTPPNAIIFGTSKVKVSDMVKIGLILDLFGLMLIILAVGLVKTFIPF